MKLFLGLIFILLDIPVTVGTAVIEVLPDFIGYAMVLKWLDDRDDPWRHLAFGLLLVSAVVFAADLVEKDLLVRIGFGCLTLAAEGAMLVLLRRLIRGQKRLGELFPVVVCVRVLTLVLGWVPLVGTVCTVANAVVTVCFLAAAYKPLVKGR